MENKGRGVLKNKLFLYLTEFFAGMSVMAVELGASRLLAPYFSYADRRIDKYIIIYWGRRKMAFQRTFSPSSFS